MAWAFELGLAGVCVEVRASVFTVPLGSGASFSTSASVVLLGVFIQNKYPSPNALRNRNYSRTDNTQQHPMVGGTGPMRPAEGRCRAIAKQTQLLRDITLPPPLRAHLAFQLTDLHAGLFTLKGRGAWVLALSLPTPALSERCNK